MKRSGTLRRGAKLMGRTRVPPVNRERRAKANARNFSDEAAAVREMLCLCFAIDHMNPCSKGRSVAAHVTARGMGAAKGGRFDIVPLCDAHHRAAGEARTSQRAEFEARYGFDDCAIYGLRGQADRIAAEHAPPLGIRGLAQRLLAIGCSEHEDHRIGIGDDGTARAMFFGHVWGVGNRYFACPNAEPLARYELDALLGWVLRECMRETDRRRSPDTFADHVAKALGLDESLAAQLLDAAKVRRG